MKKLSLMFAVLGIVIASSACGDDGGEMEMIDAAPMFDAGAEDAGAEDAAGADAGAPDAQ